MRLKIYQDKLSALRFLPEEDKSFLQSKLAISYGHAQADMPSLSIFRKGFKTRLIQNAEVTNIEEEQLFYIGCHFRNNLSVFIDNNKKFIFQSRHYFTHLNSFLDNIDACLYHVNNINLADAIDIGVNYLSIERWFVTYGHYKDEAFTVADVLARLPNPIETRVLLDYPTDDRLDTDHFKSNKNYQKIDRLLFSSRSINAYQFGSVPLALRDLKLVTNHYNSATFHSFPTNVAAQIRAQVKQPNLPRGPTRLFLTRGDSYRDIANKIEVEAHCARLGYTVINPEQISFEELVNMSWDAEHVICFWGSACSNWVYFRPGTKICVLKSTSYLDESISLWSKVIKAYELSVSEVVSIDNIVSIAQLDAIQKRLGQMTHDECINLFQKYLARSPSSTELSFHSSKKFAEFENEIQSCPEAESLRLLPLGYQILCGNEMYCTPLNELGIRVSGRLLFCSSHNNSFNNSGLPQYTLLVTDRDNRIVLNSNGHLTYLVQSERSYGPIAPQHTPHYIRGIAHFYNKIVKDSANVVNVTEPMFYLANVYSGWNIGHDLSATLYAIESYLAFCDENPYCSALRIVLSEDSINKSKNISDLIELYIPRNRWFLAKSDVIYQFRYLDVPPTKHFSLLVPQGQKLLTEAVNLALKQSDRYYMQDASPNPLNVILVKLEKHTAARRSGVVPDWVISKILELWRGWVVLNPEELHFFKIAEILSQCERVVIGNGAIAYAHVGLINSAATIYVPFRDHRYTISPDQSIFLDIDGDQCFDPNVWDKFFERIAGDFQATQNPESLTGLSVYLKREPL
jgi:hypothetical protein